MAAPNIVNVSSITGKTAVATLATSTTNIITCGTNTVSKLNTVIISNSTNSAVTANVMINRSTVPYLLGGTVTVPAYSTLVLLGKDTSIYLEEGDVIQANASVAAGVNFTASYEIIS